MLYNVILVSALQCVSDMCVYINIYMCVYIYTHTHTHTHIYALTSNAEEYIHTHIYALTSNTEEAEAEWFCEDLQDF